MANDNLRKVLNQKITDLSEMEPGTEEHTRLSNDIAKLYALIQEDEKQEWEIEKLEYEDDEKTRDIERENQIRKDDRLHSWLQFGLTSAIGVGTTLLTMAFWKDRYHEGLQFEKEGTYTAKGGAQSVMRHFPKIGK